MPTQVKITSIKADGQQLRVTFNLGLSGSYTTAVGGDTVDFTSAVPDPSFQGLVPQVISSQPPVSLDIWDQSGLISNGIAPSLGTAQNNSKVKFTTAFNTELGSGAYPGGLTGAKICGEAVWNSKLL